MKTQVKTQSKARKTTQNSARRSTLNTRSQQYRLYSGWQRDSWDDRDLHYVPRRKSTRKIFSLISECPEVYDQGKLGSCVFNMDAFLLQFAEMKQGLADPFMPSRLYLYYNARVMQGTVRSDSGSQVRTGIKTAAKQGFCPEKMWSYDISQFKKKPTPDCYAEGKKHRALKYMRVERDIEHLKACLEEGYPIGFGFTVFESFESAAVAKTGMVPMPKKGEKNLGGHAVAIVGFDDNLQCFIVRNSWGKKWGKKGYFYMPYAYILNKKLSSDFWTIRLVSASTAARARKKAHLQVALAA
jgi:C1A family cysteine protease